MSRVCRVAVVQACPVMMNRTATLEKVSKLCQEAKQGGAELVLFPEAFVSCYPRGCDFGTIVGSRTNEGRELYRLYVESSVEVPGPAVDTLSNIAKENDVQLVIGVIEREYSTLYCTVLFFDNLGTFLGKHRKLMPTAQERVVWGQGDGSTATTVLETKIGKVGAVICWENYMPLLRMSLYAKGVEIYCAPTADNRESWTSTMRHIAMEGRCFVLGCNQFGRVEDYPPSMNPDKLFPGKGKDEVVCRGGSVVVSPLGNILAGPVYDKEAIIYADLDMGEILRGKMDFDVVGHYARPDVFQLNVNETKTLGVTFQSGNYSSEQM